VRPEGRLFFINAQNVTDRINELVAQHRPRVLVLDMSRVPDIEYSALQALMDGEKRAAGRGIVFWLAGLNPGVLEMVRHAQFDQRLGPGRMLFNAREAIARYEALGAAPDGAPPPTRA
jgi:MFS superfamily sulfate permease-like transporter